MAVSIVSPGCTPDRHHLLVRIVTILWTRRAKWHDHDVIGDSVLVGPMMFFSNQVRKTSISATPRARSSLMNGTAMLLGECSFSTTRNLGVELDAHHRFRIYGPTYAGLPNLSR